MDLSIYKNYNKTFGHQTPAWLSLLISLPFLELSACPSLTADVSECSVALATASGVSFFILAWRLL